jgi:hypothetical protein
MPAGRISKLELTPEIAGEICKDIEAGNTLDCAARCAGIGRTTLHRWRRMGSKSIEPYATFEIMVDMATAKAERKRVSVLSDAMTSPKGAVEFAPAQWWLSRACPDSWADTRKVDIKVRQELDGVLDKLQSKLPHEVYELILNVIASEDDSGAEAGEVEEDEPGDLP